MTIHYLPDGIIRAITVHEPWATLMCMGIKTCEIRAWPLDGVFRLPMTLAVHASADDTYLGDDIDAVVRKHDAAYYALQNPEGESCVPGKDYFYSQVIVGLVDVIGCMLIDKKWKKAERIQRVLDAGFTQAHAEWAQGPYSFFLANPRRFKTGIQCRGQLKIWKVDPTVQAYIEANVDNLLERRCNVADPEPQFELMPTVPVGVVKCLGKPNYSEIDRKSKESISKATT